MGTSLFGVALRGAGHLGLSTGVVDHCPPLPPLRIYCAYLATKPQFQQERCHPAFKGKATKQRTPRGVCVPYIFCLVIQGGAGCTTPLQPSSLPPRSHWAGPAWLEWLITLSIPLLIRNYRSLGLEIPVKSACPQRDSPNYCSPNESWMHSLKTGHNVNVPLTNHPFQISPV